MSKTKIGVQCMMLKDKFEDMGPYQTLKKVAELGYYAVEISQIPMTAENVQEIKRASEDFGIDVASISANVAPQAGGNDDLETQYDKIVQDCKALGVDLVRIGMLPFPNMKNLDTVLEFTRQANSYARRLKEEHNIRLFYHNHHVEFRKYEGKFMLDIIADECPDLGFEIDCHWVQRGGAVPTDILEKYADRVELVHLKDYRIAAIPDEAFAALEAGDQATFYDAFVNVVQFAEIGEGSMDYQKIVSKAVELGIPYLLVEQDMLYGRDAFDCLKTSRDNLISYGFKDLF